MACGLTGVLLYFGCIILMVSVGHDGTIKFFNMLLHGIDVSGIIRHDIPLWEAAGGILLTFVLRLADRCFDSGILQFINQSKLT